MIKKILSLSLLILSVSCISHTNISEKYYLNVETKLSQNDYENAAKQIEKSKDEYGKKNKLLFFMDAGWAYHLANKNIESQGFFTEADRTLGDYYTKSFFNHDRFEGEDFEKVLITIFRALGYAYHNNLEDAAVEARKVNKRLKSINAERTIKSKYIDDAFARYLAGIFYESQQDYNDAFISYMKAYNLYKNYLSYYGVNIPSHLKKSLKRHYHNYASSKQAKQLENELSYVNIEDNKNKGRLIFAYYNGYSPKKVRKVASIIPKNRTIKRKLSMAYPDFEIRNRQIKEAKLNINGTIYDFQTVHPIGQIAILNLRERIKRSWSLMVSKRENKYLNDRKIAINNKISQVQSTLKSKVYSAKSRNCIIDNYNKIDCSTAKNNIKKVCYYENGKRDCKYKAKRDPKAKRKTCLLVRREVRCPKNSRKRRCFREFLDCSQEEKFANKIKSLRCYYDINSRHFSCNENLVSYNYHTYERELERSFINLAQKTDFIDLRSWRLVPDEISLVDINLNPGNYNMELTFYDYNNNVIERKNINAQIKKEKQTFKWYRTVK